MPLWIDNRTVQDTLGRAVPNASVYWLEQPFNVAAVPPSTLVPVATSSTGIILVANNPQITNGYGQASAYMLAGIYTVVIVWSGKIQQVYPDQVVGSLAVPLSLSTINVQDYGAEGGGKAAINNCVANTGSTSITLFGTAGAGSTFSADDAGKTIMIMSGGVDGANLYTTIDTVISPTSIIIHDACSTTPASPGHERDCYWWTPGQNDTVGLQAAINAVNPDAEQVYAPAGVYIYDDTLTSVTNLKAFYGDGAESTIFVAASPTAAKRGFFRAEEGQFFFQMDKMRIVGPSFVRNSLITAYSVSGGTCTMTCANSFSAGDVVLIQLFSTPAAASNFNNRVYTIATASSSQFTFSTSLGNMSGTDNAMVHLDQNGIALANLDSFDWFTSQSELFIQGFAGNGLQHQQPLFAKRKQLYVTNCGGNGINIFQPPTLPVGDDGPSDTTSQYDTCYSLANDGVGYYLGFCQGDTFISCYSEGNNGAFIADSCQALSFQGCQTEEIVSKNAALPGHVFWSRSSASLTFQSCFSILYEDATVTQNVFRVDDTGTWAFGGQEATNNTFSNCFYIPSSTGGGPPPVLNAVIYFDTDTYYNSVPNLTVAGGGVISFHDLGENNSIMYEGQELTSGPLLVRLTGPQATVELVTSIPEGANLNLKQTGDTESRVQATDIGLFFGSGSAPADINIFRDTGGNGLFTTAPSTMEIGYGVTGEAASRISFILDSASTQQIVFGPGTGFPDTSIIRTGVGELTFPQKFYGGIFAPTFAGALDSGSVSFDAGWGAGAALNYITGYNTAFGLAINTSGTPLANPTVTVTFVPQAAAVPTPPATITAIAQGVSTGGLTVVLTAANTFHAGQSITLSGLTLNPGLNGMTFPIFNAIPADILFLYSPTISNGVETGLATIAGIPAFDVPPLPVVTNYGFVDGVNGAMPWQITDLSATYITLTFVGTPATGQTYGFFCHIVAAD
jgi:hypothetical protein